MTLVLEMNTDLMASYSELYEDFYEADCGCPMKPSASWGPCSPNCSSCDAAIQVKLTVPKAPSAFRKAVVVVVAVEKMKQRLPSQGLFLDSDLLDIFNSIFMEDSIPCRKFDVTSMAESVYRHFYSTTLRITDTADKCMVLQEFSGQAQLVALYLQGANAQREVKLNMALYTSQPFSRSTSKQPVTLGIVGRNFYLSCVRVGGQPELQLEKVGKLSSPIKRELLRFLFFKVGSNPSSSFESAACPGWYISTSQKNNELVTVTTMQEQTAIQNFKLVHMQ